MTTDLRKWLAFGTGVGIEIREKELDVTVSRVRPTGVSVLGSASVTEYQTRPAAEWGAELTDFLRKLGAGHVAATVLLPRHDVIVRVITLPGVNDRDLGSAIQFQLDGLHPFAEEEAVHSFARIGRSDNVLLGITRREVVDKWSALFSEAGLKIAAFSFSAAAIYSGMRVPSGDAAPRGVVAVHEAEGETEIYGESDARPVFSASFDSLPQRAVALAAAELRLPPDATPLTVAALLPKPVLAPENHKPESPEFERHALPYATSLASACRRLSLDINLLPEERRRTNSRLRYVPTVALAAILLALVGALLAESRWEDTRYLDVVQSEIKKLEPVARRAESIDKRVADTRARTQTLDDFRRRTRQDLEVLGEITRLLPPPAWVTAFEMNRGSVVVSGEAPAAAELLKTFDNSPWFKDSEFTMGIMRTGTGEGFRLKSNREIPPETAPVQPKNGQQAQAGETPGAPEAAPPKTNHAPTGATPAPAPAPVQQPRVVPRNPNPAGAGAVPPGFGGSR